MAYEIMQVHQQVYVLAYWDEVWKSYINCYLIANEDERILVDCGKAEHSTALVEALMRMELVVTASLR